MPGKRRQVSQEFKEEAVRLLAESGRPLTHVARELALRPNQLREWAAVRDDRARGTAQLGGRGAAPVAPGARGHAPRAGFPKKSGGVLRERVPVKYACIVQHRAEYAVTLMCRVLVVSRAGFYAWLQRAPSLRAHADARLRIGIRAIYAESRRSYGSPRIHRELRAHGQRHGRKRIARLMRLDGLRAKRSRRYRATTRSDATRPAAPNTLGRRFAVRELNRVWAGDVTACWTGEGWLYVAALLDLGSRRVVWWATSATLDQALTLRALRRAVVQRQPAPGLLHHSDRGTPYTGEEYQATLAATGLAVSMSRRGDCWDNAVLESFFATLKTELVHEARWTTRAEADAASRPISRAGTIGGAGTQRWTT